MTTQQRDQAFDQSAPEGIMIFNMDSQAMQVFYYPENRATGNKAEKKIWTEAEEEIYAGVVPGYPKPGDLYYNTDTNNLYAWNPTQNLWMPINTDSVGGNGGSSTSNGVTDPSVTTSETTGGTGVSSNTAIKEVIVGASAPSDASLATIAPGIIFADTTPDLDASNWDLTTKTLGSAVTMNNGILLRQNFPSIGFNLGVNESNQNIFYRSNPAYRIIEPLGGASEGKLQIRSTETGVKGEVREFPNYTEQTILDLDKDGNIDLVGDLKTDTFLPHG